MSLWIKPREIGMTKLLDVVSFRQIRQKRLGRILENVEGVSNFEHFSSSFVNGRKICKFIYLNLSLSIWLFNVFIKPKKRE